MKTKTKTNKQTKKKKGKRKLGLPSWECWLKAAEEEESLIVEKAKEINAYYNKGTKTSNNIGSSKPSHQHWAGVQLFLIFKKP